MQRLGDREHLLDRAHTERTRRWFFRECGVGLGAIALGQLLGGSARGRLRPIRWLPGPRISPPGPSESSSCSWPAARATSNCSTTSPSWRSTTASCRRPSCSRATARRSSARARRCSGPKFRFARHGRRGAELSELLPHLAGVRRRHRHRQVDGSPTPSTTRRRRSS